MALKTLRLRISAGSNQMVRRRIGTCAFAENLNQDRIRWQKNQRYNILLERNPCYKGLPTHRTNSRHFQDKTFGKGKKTGNQEYLNQNASQLHPLWQGDNNLISRYTLTNRNPRRGVAPANSAKYSSISISCPVKYNPANGSTSSLDLLPLSISFSPSWSFFVKWPT